MCILHNILVAILGKFPVGQTVDGAHVGGPLIDNLYIFLSEVFNRGSDRLGVLLLINSNLKSVGNIAALDDHLTLTGIAGVGGAGNLNGDVAGLAGTGLNGNPALGSGGGPSLLGGELGLFGLLGAVEVEFAGLELDVGHIHTVEVVIEMDILDGIPNVLGDVVLQQVVVEADHNEEGTHSGNLSCVAVEVDRALGCAEFLEVADGRRIESGAAGQIPAEFVCKELDGTRIRLGEVDNLAAVVGVLIPRPLAPSGSDHILCGSRDRLVESLTVAHSMDERVAGRLHQRRTLESDEVHNTLGCDAPALCRSIFLVIYLYVVVRLVVLAVHSTVLVTSGVLDRNEVDVLPGGVVGSTVRTVGIDGTYGTLPNVEVLNQFLGKSLEGVGSALVACIDGLAEFAVFLVIGKGTGNYDGCTVGGESDGRAVTGEVGLVGDFEILGHTLDQPLGNVHQVFGLITVLGAVGNGDRFLVVAIPLGMVGRFDGYDSNVFGLSGINVNQSLANGVLVLGDSGGFVSKSETLGELLTLFPGLVGSAGCIYNL